MPVIAHVVVFATTIVPTVLSHPGHDHLGFIAGLAHPWLGVDHLLAMLAVGAVAARQPLRRAWSVPAAFIAILPLGALLGVASPALPGAEIAVALTVIALGALLAWRDHSRLLASALAALCALAHGYAHGSELPGGSGVTGWIAGFVTASAVLHGLGFAAALAAARLGTAPLRWCGRAMTAAGVVLVALRLG